MISRLFCLIKTASMSPGWNQIQLSHLLCRDSIAVSICLGLPSVYQILWWLHTRKIEMISSH